MRFVLRQLLWVSLTLATVAVFAMVWLAEETLRAVEIPLGGAEEQRLFVPSGMGLQSLLRQLEADGLIHDAWRLRVYLRWRGLPASIRAGEYALRADMNFLQLLEALREGRVVQHRITLLEGWRFSQVRQALRHHPALKHITLSWSDAEIMARLDATGRSPEGMFFPDTYLFQRDDADLAILERAHEALEKQLQASWEQRDPRVEAVLHEPYQALVLASLIEKETAAVSERALIAGVFIERLKKQMRLQTDPSVIFGLGDAFDGNLRRRHLEDDGPYNTYTRKGLPPTPIALVGAAALRAATQPEGSGFLYFVAKGDGTHHFSSTYPEHQLAVRRYQLTPARNQPASGSVAE